MSVHLSDGRVINYDISRIDSVTFVDIPRWSNRSPEARKLLAYMADNVGKQMLTGVHASVNYNTHEADWVYKHTGKYPAINTIDFIHDRILEGKDVPLVSVREAAARNIVMARLYQADREKRLLPSDPLPIDYEIDWVRLWQRDGEPLWDGSRQSGTGG